jgi:hypothetical protein
MRLVVDTKGNLIEVPPRNLAKRHWQCSAIQSTEDPLQQGPIYRIFSEPRKFAID